jgi:putative SOS response-associated peptidase YedK
MRPTVCCAYSPYPAAAMAAWPVSQRVGNVKNNDPNLVKPIAV